jgi:predicted DNA-binding protein (MmcQ/YjbR family)
MATAAGKKAESLLRKFALGYPEAHEEFPWGERAIKVAKKVFLFMRCDKTCLSLSIKLLDSNEEALELPFTQSTGYGLGKSGWVTARFAADEPVPIEQLCSWIDESYRAIAPKKLLAQSPDAPRALLRAGLSTRQRSRRRNASKPR